MNSTEKRRDPPSEPAGAGMAPRWRAATMGGNGGRGDPALADARLILRCWEIYNAIYEQGADLIPNSPLHDAVAPVIDAACERLIGVVDDARARLVAAPPTSGAGLVTMLDVASMEFVELIVNDPAPSPIDHFIIAALKAARGAVATPAGNRNGGTAS